MHAFASKISKVIERFRPHQNSLSNGDTRLIVNPDLSLSFRTEYEKNETPLATPVVRRRGLPATVDALAQKLTQSPCKSPSTPLTIFDITAQERLSRVPIILDINSFIRIVEMLKEKIPFSLENTNAFENLKKSSFEAVPLKNLEEIKNSYQELLIPLVAQLKEEDFEPVRVALNKKDRHAALLLKMEAARKEVPKYWQTRLNNEAMTFANMKLVHGEMLRIFESVTYFLRRSDSSKVPSNETKDIPLNQSQDNFAEIKSQSVDTVHLQTESTLEEGRDNPLKRQLEMRPPLKNEDAVPPQPKEILEEIRESYLKKLFRNLLKIDSFSKAQAESLILQLDCKESPRKLTEDPLESLSAQLVIACKEHPEKLTHAPKDLGDFMNDLNSRIAEADQFLEFLDLWLTDKNEWLITTAQKGGSGFNYCLGHIAIVEKEIDDALKLLQTSEKLDQEVIVKLEKSTSFIQTHRENISTVLNPVAPDYWQHKCGALKNLIDKLSKSRLRTIEDQPWNEMIVTPFHAFSNQVHTAVKEKSLKPELCAAQREFLPHLLKQKKELSL